MFKKILTTPIALALLFSAMSFAQSAPNAGKSAAAEAALSQQQSAAVQDEENAKDLYIAYAEPHREPHKRRVRHRRGRPGAQVRIELLRAGRHSFVPLDTTFIAGDKVKFHFAVNFPAYVGVINLGSSGRLNLLFPYSNREEAVAATRDYVVPREPQLWFEFDSRPGIERLTFVFSAVRLMPTSTVASGQTMATNGGSVTVNPSSDQQLALNDLNARALDNGKDLNLVQVSAQESYVLTDEQALRQPIGFQVNLRHR